MKEYNLYNVEKGRQLEDLLSQAINNISSEIQVLQNIKFYSPKLGKDTEIDVLVITPSRVYSIECKNVRKIFCDFSSSMWMFTTDSFVSQKIINSYVQNSEHIRSLNSNIHKLGLKRWDIANIVCVPNRCEIFGDCNLVLRLEEVVYKIKKETDRLPRVYDVNKRIDVIKRIGGCHNV